MRLAASIAVSLALAACGGTAEAPIGPTFGAVLRVSDELVAPVTRTGSGSASFAVQGQIVWYGITGINLSGPAMGELHLGLPHTVGPVVVRQLFVQDPNTARSRAHNAFAQRDIQPVTPGGQPMTIDELVAQMRAGNVYVNVVTDQNPSGEIRGQLVLTEEAPSPQ